MDNDEITYLQKRAAAELELARRATHPVAKQAHFALVGNYLDLLDVRPKGRSIFASR